MVEPNTGYGSRVVRFRTGAATKPIEVRRGSSMSPSRVAARDLERYYALIGTTQKRLGEILTWSQLIAALTALSSVDPLWTTEWITADQVADRARSMLQEASVEGMLMSTPEQDVTLIEVIDRLGPSGWMALVDAIETFINGRSLLDVLDVLGLTPAGDPPEPLTRVPALAGTALAEETPAGAR